MIKETDGKLIAHLLNKEIIFTISNSEAIWLKEKESDYSIVRGKILQLHKGNQLLLSSRIDCVKSKMNSKQTFTKLVPLNVVPFKKAESTKNRINFDFHGRK